MNQREKIETLIKDAWQDGAVSFLDGSKMEVFLEYNKDRIENLLKTVI